MKKVLISILSLIFIVSTITTVYAAETGSVNLITSANSVIKGNTVTVTVKGSAETNVLGLEAKLNYDATKLELVKKEAGDNFTDASSNNSEIAVATGGVGEKNVTLMVYTFRALDITGEAGTKITVSDIILAADTNIEIENKESVIIIKEDDTQVGGGQGTGDQQPDDDGNDDQQPDDDGNDDQQPDDDGNDDQQTGDDGNDDQQTGDTDGDKTPSNTNGNKKNTTTKLPQTGVEDFSVIAIIALGAVAISSYISYRRYKNI